MADSSFIMAQSLPLSTSLINKLRRSIIRADGNLFRSKMLCKQTLTTHLDTYFLYIYRIRVSYKVCPQAGIKHFNDANR